MSHLKVIFLPSNKIEEWSEENKIKITGDIVELIGKNIKYHLTEAVMFTKCITNDLDSRKLINKALTLEKIKELGGEHYSGSVVWGDDAYEVMEGFLGTLIESAPAVEPPKATPPQPPKPAVSPSAGKPTATAQAMQNATPQQPSADKQPKEKSASGEKSDVELLSEFLLGKH